MITKFNDYIKEGVGNTSVRDLMTPKSDEDVRQAYINLVNSLDDSSPDKFLDEFQIDFERIADLFGVTKDSLYLISEEGDKDYETFEDFFEAIADTDNKIIIKGVENEYGETSGEWTCYPDQKVARWSANDFDSPHAWIFPKNLFKDKLYESIRDLMTPKSREDIINSLEGDRSVVFKPSYVDDNMTYEMGRIDVSYDDLVKLFGEPNGYGDDYKISTYWTLEDNKGRVATIHDWKNTNLYEDDLPSVEEFRKFPSYQWTICTTGDKNVVVDLKTFIILQII